ncbi:MAG: hypothetical protein E6G45_13260, partial [Actinobacteria bacterium]
MPDVVRPVADVPGAARVNLNPEQQAAVDARGHAFVSAGAGTGKTKVLVERFARAVCDEGLDIESVLVITYTEKAAGELRARIRARLAESGRQDLARALDGAWISTIHGFCHRLLRSHPFAAGVDPRFRVLDESQGRVLRTEAFEAALDEFCANDDGERLRLLAVYGARNLLLVADEANEALDVGTPQLFVGPRKPRELAEIRVPAAAVPLRENGEVVVVLRDDSFAETLERQARRQRGEPVVPLPERAQKLRVALRNRLRNPTVESGEQRAPRRRPPQQHQRVVRHAHERGGEHAHERLVVVAVVEQSQIREQLRFRSIMVDEFQDTNRLQCELIDFLAGGPGEKEVFFVGDEFQSIYGFRHADVQVFRERRDASPNMRPLTLNYRSRPEVLAVVNHLFGGDFGDEFQPLAASGEFPDPVFGAPVELLVTDKSSYAEDEKIHWRRAEA